MIAADVAVVGAGFAGLSAAAALAEAGRRVLVLDARPQLGGRATAFIDRVTGELVDNGQHVLFGCYYDTFRFLRRIGAEDNVRVQSGLSIPFIDRRGRRLLLQCPPLPAPLHLLGGVLDWDALPWRDRLSIFRVARPILKARRAVARGQTSLAEPDETVAGWLSRHGQRRKLRAWLWNPLAVAALNQAPEEASAAPFVRVLAEMFAPDASASAIALPTKPLHLMYAEPARHFIEARGGEVRTNALARVLAGPDGVEAVEIRGERVPLKQIVVAVPWFGLRTLFAPTPPASLEQMVASADRMESKPIVTVNLWYDGTVLRESFVGLPGRVMQWVFDKRLAFGETASHLSLVSSGADALVRESDDALILLAAQEVDEAFPATEAELVRGTVVREKRATFSLAPGQPARPATVTPVRGLFLAGDWLDTGLPGTIESAVISGHRAAAAVLSA